MKFINGIEVLTTRAELLAPDQCALLVIDMQNENLKDDGGYAQHGTEVRGLISVAAAIRNLLAAARVAGVPVFYTEFIHRSQLSVNLTDGPNLYVHRDAAFVSEIQEGTWQAQTIAELSPQPGDVVLTKTRGSAFHGTPLTAQLLNRGIHSVVLTGMITQGCVLHTHADALMQGFYPVVACDGVGSYEEEWHELAMRWMARKSPVYSVNEICAEWGETRTLRAVLAGAASVLLVTYGCLDGTLYARIITDDGRILAHLYKETGAPAGRRVHGTRRRGARTKPILRPIDRRDLLRTDHNG